MKIISETPYGDQAWLGAPPAAHDPCQSRGGFYLPDRRVIPRMASDGREKGCEIHPMRGSVTALAVFAWERGRLICRGWVHVDDLRPYGRICYTARDWAAATGYDLAADRDDVIERLHLPPEDVDAEEGDLGCHAAGEAPSPDGDHE